jgi:hypothetical protein
MCIRHYVREFVLLKRCRIMMANRGVYFKYRHRYRKQWFIQTFALNCARVQQIYISKRSFFILRTTGVYFM